MKYQEATVENGSIKITKSVEIDQNKLTADCWLIQFNGLSACNTCEFKNTEECGGGMTLLKMLQQPQNK